jgi:hypothetical protein
VYLPLEGIKESGEVTCSIETDKIDVRIRGWRKEGQVHAFVVKKLFGDIDPNQSSLKVRPDKIVLTLRKKSSKAFSSSSSLSSVIAWPRLDVG